MTSRLVAFAIAFCLVAGTHIPYDTPQFPLNDPPPLTLYPLFQSGVPSNRVDLVFFSDGYTAEEEHKFVQDAKRLSEDVSSNQTFSTVTPLLNFWAAFTPSAESGVGVGGVPKDTVYGLYRDGTELRGVYYAKPEVARAACDSLGEQCDYPILLGNDPYYGGLGGEFTVITSSLLNGPLVLRHELGHSIIEIGEEYDGGPTGGYFGCNAALNRTDPFPWSHWLSSSSIDSSSTTQTNPHPIPRAERSTMPFQAYPWTLLSASEPWSATFTSSGLYAHHVVRFSLSGLPEADDLRVTLDGTDLGWVPRHNVGLDRWHYDIPINSVLPAGNHILIFSLKNEQREGVAQLCSAEVMEFGNATEFNTTLSYIGAFPTYSELNETSYRPTNEGCLMRQVTTPDFCPVCLEGLWLSLLRRVRLIEDVTTHCEVALPDVGQHEATLWTRSISVELVPLAHLRTLDSHSTTVKHEAYKITWTKDGRSLPQFANATSISVDGDAEDSLGAYGIEVTFHTPEVRVDRDHLLVSSGDFLVTSRCSDAV